MVIFHLYWFVAISLEHLLTLHIRKKIYLHGHWFLSLRFSWTKKKKKLSHVLILYFNHKTNSTYPRKAGQSRNFTFGWIERSRFCGLWSQQEHTAKSKAIITLWWLQQNIYFKSLFIFYAVNMDMNCLLIRFRSKAIVSFCFFKFRTLWIVNQHSKSPLRFR